MLNVPIKRQDQGIVVKNAEVSTRSPDLLKSTLVHVTNSP